jgi:hypothetical protein
MHSFLSAAAYLPDVNTDKAILRDYISDGRLDDLWASSLHRILPIEGPGGAASGMTH